MRVRSQLFSSQKLIWNNYFLFWVFYKRFSQNLQHASYLFAWECMIHKKTVACIHYIIHGRNYSIISHNKNHFYFSRWIKIWVLLYEYFTFFFSKILDIFFYYFGSYSWNDSITIYLLQLAEGERKEGEADNDNKDDIVYADLDKSALTEGKNILSIFRIFSRVFFKVEKSAKLAPSLLFGKWNWTEMETLNLEGEIKIFFKAFPLALFILHFEDKI